MIISRRSSFIWAPESKLRRRFFFPRIRPISRRTFFFFGTAAAAGLILPAPPADPFYLGAIERDSDLIEARRFSTEEICRIFRVPRELLRPRTLSTIETEKTLCRTSINH